MTLAALGFAGVLAAAPTASANGAVGNALITELALSGNVAWLRFNVALGTSNPPNNTRPACIASGWQDYFMFDHTTAQGKSFLTMLSAAMLAGKRVDASGVTSGTLCTNSTAETLGYLKVYP